MPALMNSTPNAIQNNQPNNPNPGAAVSGSQTGQAGAQPASFARSSKFHIEQGITQTVANTSWASGYTQQYQIPTYGWMDLVNLTFALSNGAKGSSTTVAGSEDSPWDLLSNINITDVNGTAMMNLPGYSAFLAYLWGGYRVFRSNESTYGYTPIDGTSAGGTGTGNAKFKFQFPFSFGQDGLGSLPNMDNSAQYRINLTYNGPSTFYNGASQEPGTLPGISTLLELQARNKAAGVDAYGNPQSTEPPARGTIQNWTSQVIQLSSGNNTLQLTRTGNIIRNQILIFRDSNGSRSGAESSGVVPSVIEYDIDAGIRYKVNTDTQRNFLYEYFNMDVPQGCIMFPNFIDHSNLPASEYGAAWLPTTGATKLQLQFTTSAAGTLEVVTNDIIPGSGAIYSAAGMAVLV